MTFPPEPTSPATAVQRERLRLLGLPLALMLPAGARAQSYPSGMRPS